MQTNKRGYIVSIIYALRDEANGCSYDWKRNNFLNLSFFF